MTFLKMTTMNMHMKFEIEFQIKLDLHPGNLVTFRVQKLKNLIWLPGGHFENDIAENQ